MTKASKTLSAALQKAGSRVAAFPLPEDNGTLAAKMGGAARLV